MDGKIPAWCPICDRLMKWDRNRQTYIRYGCCVNCFIAFVEDREEKWLSGWRPSAEELKAYEERVYSRMWPGEES